MRSPQVHPLPDKISFEQGAALGVPYATAYYGMFLRGKAMAGETVLVDGASGGVAASFIFYFDTGFQVWNDSPRSGSFIDALARPSGY